MTEEETKKINEQPKRQYEIEICMNCGKDVVGLNECTCGGTQIIYGKGFKYTPDCILCDCKNTQFRLTSHMNMVNKHLYTFVCTKCSNTIGKQSLKNKEDYDNE